MWHCDAVYGEYTGPECWTKLFLAIDFVGGYEGILEGEPDSFKIDSGIGSVGTIPGLEKCLGLPHIKNPFVKAVCDVNNKRAGVNINQKKKLQDAWKAEIEQKLAAASCGSVMGLEEDN